LVLDDLDEATQTKALKAAFVAGRPLRDAVLFGTPGYTQVLMFYDPADLKGSSPEFVTIHD
jgi:hypothetical protein